MRRREIIARFVCAIVFCTWVASASADDLLNEALDASLASGDIRSVVAMLHIGVEDTRSAKRAFRLTRER